MKQIPYAHRTTSAAWKPALALTVISIAILALISACQSHSTAVAPTVYRADIHPLNAELTGLEPSGTATVTVTTDSVRIQVDAEELPPAMMHMMHIHGFADNTQATCPTTMQDANHDNIIDDPEAETSTGPPLIPLNNNPVVMNAGALTYPAADSSGKITYDVIMPLSALKTALKSTQKITGLEFDKRIIMIHGIMGDSTLAETVESPPGVPAATTVPIACGEFERVSPPEP